MTNNPQYKIHGEERRSLKKELSLLKSFVKNFWYYHQLEKDMYSIYCAADINKYVLSDEAAKQKFDEVCLEIKKREEDLSVLYNS